jgi:protein-S-isoprenylcysteine O-methyltransferase Ste14
MANTLTNTTQRWAFRARGLAGSLVMILFGMLAVFSVPWVFAGTWLELACEAVAWMVFLTGATFRLWSTLYIGGRKAHALMADGPYSLCRNPLYVGTFLIWFSAAIFLKSVTLGAGVVVGILFYIWFVVPDEEDRLRAVLGHAYDDYCRSVPRFVPRLSHFQTAATINVDLHGLWLECRRAMRWVWLPLASEIISHARSLPGWPQWFNLP